MARPPGTTVSRATRAARVAAAGLAAGLGISLAACTPTVTGGWDEDGAETGYVSGDRSVTTWEPADRTGPVEIAGTDFAGLVGRMVRAALDRVE